MSQNSNVVLVTGSCGWLGSRLVETLVEGLGGDERFDKPPANLEVRCLDTLPATAQESRAGLVHLGGDIRNPADCERLCAEAIGAVLFHTAGVIHPRRVSQFYEINVRGTRNLLEAAIRAGVKRAVIVSSNSPCGCNPHPDHLFDESSPYRPYMGYGRSKMLMEMEVKKVQQSGNLETVIVRPPWFYGPNQPPRQTLFFRMIRDGKAPIVGSGKNLRSMGYIDNLCQGLRLAGSVEQANGQTYWLADRRPYSMNEIVDTVERLLENEFGRRCAHKRLRLPGFASGLAYLADKCLQTAGFYHQKIHVLSEMNKTIACSVAKARRELGYEPRIELEEGMRRSLAWCVRKGFDI